MGGSVTVCTESQRRRNQALFRAYHVAQLDPPVPYEPAIQSLMSGGVKTMLADEKSPHRLEESGGISTLSKSQSISRRPGKSVKQHSPASAAAWSHGPPLAFTKFGRPPLEAGGRSG